MRRPVLLSALVFSAAACGSSPRTSGVADAGKKPDAPASTVKDAAPDAPDVASPTCTIAVPSLPTWHLTTDGPLLKDALGRTVYLRGVNAGGRSKFAPYAPFDYAGDGDGGAGGDGSAYSAALEAYMAHAQTWGIDVMRVPFTWDALEPTRTEPPTYDAAWLARYTALLTSAWQHGIYTIVDFHQDIYAQVFCGDGFPAWTLPLSGVKADAGPPAHDCPSWFTEYYTNAGVIAAFDAFWPEGSPTRTAYVEAWDEMISQVGGTPGLIGFEPINEPSSGSANETTFEQTTLTQFYSAMAAEMNAKAPEALVFFDPPGIDGVMVSTSMGKPTGQNLVFAPHFYPTETAQASDVEAMLGNWAAYTKTWNVPVWVGEFGASHLLATTPAYMQWVFQGIDALPLVGGTEWQYSESPELWNSETDCLTNPDGGDLPVAQAIHRPFAKAVAGTGVTQSYDVGRSYTLKYTASEGVTEIRSPISTAVRITGGCYDASSTPGELLVKAPVGTAVTVTIFIPFR